MSPTVGPEKVQQRENIIERLSDYLDSDDNYLSAMLVNQIVMEESLNQIVTQLGGDPSSGTEEAPLLKYGLLGESTTEMNAGDTGEAMFTRDGDRIIAKVTAARSSIRDGQFVMVTDADQRKVIPIDEGDVPLEESGGGDKAEYFSKPRVTVDSTEEDSVEWEFNAETVVVWGITSEVELAFKQEDEDNRLIPVTGSDSPFSLSPPGGLGAKKLWYSKPDSSVNDTEMNILALK
jgi:hypothetical protein